MSYQGLTQQQASEAAAGMTCSNPSSTTGGGTTSSGTTGGTTSSPPTADNQTDYVYQSNSEIIYTVPINLTGNASNGAVLTYTIVTPPQYGSLTGTPPNLIYSPHLYYSGTDTLSFKVNDGKNDSSVATVSITIIGGCYMFADLTNVSVSNPGTCDQTGFQQLVYGGIKPYVMLSGAPLNGRYLLVGDPTCNTFTSVGGVGSYDYELHYNSDCSDDATEASGTTTAIIYVNRSSPTANSTIFNWNLVTVNVTGMGGVVVTPGNPQNGYNILGFMPLFGINSGTGILTPAPGPGQQFNNSLNANGANITLVPPY